MIEYILCMHYFGTALIIVVFHNQHDNVYFAGETSDFIKERQTVILSKQDHFAEIVTSFQQVYRTAQPPTWDPLPQCQHVKLAMIKKKGKRYGRAPSY